MSIRNVRLKHSEYKSMVCTQICSGCNERMSMAV